VNLTATQLSAATGASIDRAQQRLQSYITAMDVYSINTRLRAACFLAQVGHESGGFQYSAEIWGPTKAQLGYEGRADMGNTWPGDGERFKGRGDIETTGRKNYALARERLRTKFPDLNVPDFEASPDSLSLPLWAALSAADYIDMRGLNAIADVCNFDSYCDIVNRGRVTAALGDSNGFARRLALFMQGMRALP
jgi:putative chitinase